jgi:hypothetical protein
MLIAYFTTDEVNEWVAERLAADCGLTLCAMFLKDVAAEEGFDAMVFDWDFLPAAWREEALTMLTTRPLDCPVAVHSYHLAEHEVEALRANGVQVRQWLQPALLHDLFRTVVQARLILRSYSAAPATTDGEHEPAVGPSQVSPPSPGSATSLWWL